MLLENEVDCWGRGGVGVSAGKELKEKEKASDRKRGWRRKKTDCIAKERG